MTNCVVSGLVLQDVTDWLSFPCVIYFFYHEQ